MKNLAKSEYLKVFASELKARNALPRNIQISKLGSVFMASVFDTEPLGVISESVYTGMDLDPDVAVLKGLVEMTEWRAFAEGKRRGDRSCLSDRSDGFAAFPRGITPETEKMARNNALNEAIERFVWANWWDDDSYNHQLSEIPIDALTTPSVGLLKDLQQIIPVRYVYRVQPEVANSPRAAVAIYFALLEPYGVISGGACDSPENIEVANFRAICELARHGIAAQKMKADGYEPKSFYEKRLAHFALTKAGEDRVLVRINAKGNRAIALPTLAIDETLAHSHSQSVVVHRCLFQGQPPFVGGDLERLCL